MDNTFGIEVSDSLPLSVEVIDGEIIHETSKAVLVDVNSGMWTGHNHEQWFPKSRLFWHETQKGFGLTLFKKW